MGEKYECCRGISIRLPLVTEETNLRVLWIRSFQDVAKKQFRVLIHDCAREGVTLVWAQIMTVAPTTTDKLFEISAWIELFVVW
jgi:hypothetical protein